MAWYALNLPEVYWMVRADVAPPIQSPAGYSSVSEYLILTIRMMYRNMISDFCFVSISAFRIDLRFGIGIFKKR
ncbi:MAG TPA: hypothetical protein DCF33_03290 [Saprospirales bacterium]|nr:hypothetical protein [Saprospirales bacterium]